MKIEYDIITRSFVDIDSGCSWPFLYGDKFASGANFNLSAVSDYHFCYLYKEKIKPDECVEISLKDRIGYLIPLTAITNFQLPTEYATKPIRWYVFLAQYHSLQVPPPIDYPDDVVCAVLSKADFPKGFSYDEKRFKCSLLSDGYTEKWRQRNSLLFSNPPQKLVKAKVRPCSAYLSSETYISELVHTHIYESSPIKYFLWLYQTFEILMEDVVMDTFLNEIVKSGNGDLNMRGKMSENTEFDRMKKILELTGVTHNQNFHNDCLTFLLKVGKDRRYIQAFPDSLYQVRNTLVHRLRRVYGDSDAIALLKKVNEYFELLVFEILYKYKKSSSFQITDKADMCFYLNETI